VNPFSVRNKNVVITGANSGIGLALAQGFVDNGAEVIVSTRTSQISDELDRLLKFPQVLGFVMDISDIESIMNASRFFLARLDIKIDVLINCAGMTDPKRWDKTIATNLTGTYNVTKEVVGLMGSGGSIMNVTSIGSIMGFPDNQAYVASKGGVRMLTKALASDLAHMGIRVNSLCPGYFRTKMTEASYQDRKKHDARINRMMIKRFGRPEELVGPAIFLASNASSYMTGADLIIDGGWTANGL